MAINSTYGNSADSLSDGNDLVLDASESETGAVNITELGGNGSCTIYKEFDPNDDGTWEVSTQIDSPTDTWHSQDNDLLISQSEKIRIRIVNNSGGTADVWAVGYEVTD